VAVEDPARSFEPRHPERARVCVLNEFDDDAGVHVLVVSRTETEQDLCEAALTANPEAIVSTCNSLQAAVELMKQCYHDGTQINLICIDAELLQPHNYDTDESAARKVRRARYTVVHDAWKRHLIHPMRTDRSDISIILPTN